VIAVDTNVLVYAHRPEVPEHDAARSALRRLLVASESWGVPWTVAYEFLSVVTQPRIWMEPTTPDGALAALAAWGDQGAVFLPEGSGHRTVLARLLHAAPVRGGRVFDARVAATCLDHGVRELWSVDRDFGRFAGLRVVNPLLA
jgi:toxin-antitoxin system PIN domain toxin